MEKYIGVKLIQAEPMELGDFEKVHGTRGNEKLSGDSPGYCVLYEGGYYSWSPKEVFEEAYRKTLGLTFGMALEAVKKGLLIARQGWNGKGMFVFMRPEDELPVPMVVNQVKLLPKSLKDWVYNHSNPSVPLLEQKDTIKFTAYLCMKAADGSIVNGWLASQTDMLSDDWCILE